MRRRDRISTRRVVAAAVTGLVAALAGCSSGGATPDPAAPIAPPPETAPPLGLDVRYVDKDGNFQVLRVPDFPR